CSCNAQLLSSGRAISSCLLLLQGWSCSRSTMRGCCICILKWSVYIQTTTPCSSELTPGSPLDHSLSPSSATPISSRTANHGSTSRNSPKNTTPRSSPSGSAATPPSGSAMPGAPTSYSTSARASTRRAQGWSSSASWAPARRTWSPCTTASGGGCTAS
ncbi:hypothetical protein T310_9321, partial [Rasamsonia emersonii CBS 393.64]